MPVKLQIKGITSSNKTQYYDLHLSDIAYNYGKDINTVRVLYPIIDKISLTIPVLSIDDQAMYRAQIMDLSKDEDISHFESVSLPGSKYKYGMNWKYQNESILIQADPHSPTVKNFLRLEFNPSKLGEAGMAALKDMIFIEFSMNSLPYQSIVDTASCTRLDIACDLINAPTSEIIAQGTGAGKKHTYHDTEGNLETAYLDLSNFGQSKKMMYNKLQQQIDTAEEPSFAGVNHTRVEVIHGSTMLFKLPNIQNPLTKVRVIHPLVKPPKTNDLIWNLFLDSCRYRGVNQAIRRLPQTMRGPFQMALDNAAQATWRPAKLWTKWPELVARLLESNH